MGLNNRDNRRLINNLIMGWKAYIIFCKRQNWKGMLLRWLNKFGEGGGLAMMHWKQMGGGSSYCGMKKGLER